ncbi:hypothetical protein LC593_31480 [Nostoc sp. CHAB 5844]|nr:hypothetical protein [Nostoc sp. CHAB 5844]
MDTDTDLLFLSEEIVANFNPYQEGEYLVIQSYPYRKSLRVNKRSFDYDEARKYCELENLAHDDTSFALRVVHEKKLHLVDFSGCLCSLSLQQDWKIAPEYLAAGCNENTDGEILICSCSYPYFWSLATCTNIGEVVEYWQPITCLIDDHGREIDSCPNCHIPLLDDDPEDDFDD